MSLFHKHKRVRVVETGVLVEDVIKEVARKVHKEVCHGDNLAVTAAMIKATLYLEYCDNYDELLYDEVCVKCSKVFYNIESFRKMAEKDALRYIKRKYKEQADEQKAVQIYKQAR